MVSELNILFVEDLSTDAELIKREIRKSGIEFKERVIDTEEDFIQAIHTSPPDLILSDYSLPGFDGMRALQIQQELAPLIPFVLVTGSVNEETAVECMKAGADDYVIKHNLKRLGAAIQGAIEKKQLIAEKKEVEKTLRNSEERYRSLFEDSAVPILEEDFSRVKKLFDELKASGVTDFRAYIDKHPEDIVKCASLITISNVNSESIRFFQAKDKQEIFDDLSACFMDETWPVFKEEIISLAEGKLNFESEIQVATFKWEHRHLILKLSVRPDCAETLNQVLVSFVDITAYKETEAALMESEELFRTSFENATVGVCLVNPSNEFLSVNNALCNLLGYSKEELLSLKFSDITLEEDKEIGMSQMKLMLDGALSMSNFEKRYLHKNGSVIWAIVSTGIVHSTNKRIEYFVTYIEDITERKQAELTIRKSADLYCALTENMKEVIWILDPDTLRFRYISPSAQKMVGFTSEEIMTFPMQKIVDPKYSEKLVHDMQKIIDDASSGREKPGTYHTQVAKQPCKDGSYIWAEITAYAYFNEETGKLELRGVHRDVTEQRKAEERLSKSEEKFRLLAENSSDVIWTMDIKGNNTYISPSVERLRGYTPQEALLQTENESLTPESAIQARDFMNKAMAQIEKGGRFDSYCLILEQPCKNQSTVWVEVTVSGIFDDNGKFVSFLGVSRNITERKIAEEQLQEKQFWLTESQRVGRIGSYSFNITNNKWSSSPVLDDILGLDESSERTLESWISIIDISQREEMQQYFLNEVLSNKSPFNKQYKICRINDGVERWILGLGELVMDRNGYPIKMIGTIQDITEHKKSEEALISAKEKAIENDRLKTAFLNNISHEIRTPMNAIIGFSGFLNEPNLLPEKRKYFTDIICNASNQLLLIITDIINIATIETGQEIVNNNKFNLNNTLKDLYKQFEVKASNQQLRFNCQTSLPDEETSIDTDETKLVQILSNLIGNALKFTKSGQVDFGYTIKENFLEFYIRDTGIGIPENMHEEIFERFRQADSTIARQYGGTGLGLSISKAYVELLGGKIWLTSETGKGSVFYFTLPFEVKRNGHSKKHGFDSDEVFNLEKQRTILVAEDEDFNFMLLEQIFSGLNVNLIRVLNGAEAVMTCKTNPDIEIVIMDVKMPIMDGYEATKLIKQDRPELPIMIQTAYARESDRIKAFECGCDEYVSKPLVINDFLALLEKHFSAKSSS